MIALSTDRAPLPTENIILQSGVIPYRIRRGQIEIAMVTASSGPHWTIPKGHVEPGMSPQDSAAKEAFEESGLLGDVESRCIGSYVYEKRGTLRQVKLYPLAVTRELKRWPEMNERKRRWMSIEEAASRVRSAELRCCIQQFEHELRRRHQAIAA
jgi:8-oxo-dGTP pyrophosphatase MutT (NUDIX family)